MNCVWFRKSPVEGLTRRVFARNRYSWGLFSGTKDDLREPTAVQPVAQQMNLHAGVQPE